MRWKFALAIGLATAALSWTGIEPAAATPLPQLKPLAATDAGATLVRYRGGRHYAYRPHYSHRYRPVVPYSFYYGAPVVTYYGGYASKCTWLRHKARETGSRHLWRRYREEC